MLPLAGGFRASHTEVDCSPWCALVQRRSVCKCPRWPVGVPSPGSTLQSPGELKQHPWKQIHECLVPTPSESDCMSLGWNLEPYISLNCICDVNQVYRKVERIVERTPRCPLPRLTNCVQFAPFPWHVSGRNITEAMCSPPIRRRGMSVGPNVGETHFDYLVKVVCAAFTTKLLFSSL